MTRVAGFEWGSGFYINPLPPEDACKGVKVSARVREHKLGPKINIRTYKAKKSSSRRMGYRSRQSVIEIESIAFGKSTPAKEADSGA